MRVKFKYKNLVGNYVLIGEGTDGYFLILVERQKAKKGFKYNSICEKKLVFQSMHSNRAISPTYKPLILMRIESMTTVSILISMEAVASGIVP